MSFDLLAPHYRWMEAVLAGEKLQRGRVAFLDRVAGARDVLILGEGNGRFLAECRRVLPSARITCVDASARMLALARERLLKERLAVEGVEFIHADALAWTPRRGGFDLIVTHFFLDCFRADQLAAIAAKLAAVATPGADWLLADFQAPARGWQRTRARIILGSMYAFFRVAARLPARHLTPPDESLARHGFTLRERRESEWGLLRSDWWRRSAVP